MLVGDFGQLPPVGDRPLFCTKWDEQTSPRKALQNAGRLAYMAISESISLDVVMRQDGRDEETERFKETLARLRSGTPTRTDFDLLRTRFWTELSPAEQRDFDDCQTLSTVRESVALTNKTALVESARPVMRIPARNSGPGSEKANEQQTEGLASNLYLMNGAKVMITRNLWTTEGLTNGTMGWVHAIGLAEAEVAGKDLPSVVIVAVPAYTGPTAWRWGDGTPLVPITPVTITWETSARIKCSRSQYPLQLAYAVTVHKSQGMTLARAVIVLGEKEFSAGLTFVAISRVKSLRGLAFRPGFPLSRILDKVPGNIGSRTAASDDEVRRGRLGFRE